MKRLIFTLVAVTMLLALTAPLTSAHIISNQPVAQDAKTDEAAAYTAWYNANAAKDYPKAMELAKAYLEKFPNGQNAKYLTGWIPQTRARLLGEAVQAKNIPDVIRLGKEAVAANPDGLDFPLYLTIQVRTLDTNFQYAADLAGFAQTSIRLIEAGKTPTGSKDFKKNETLAYFHDTLASIDDHNKDKAGAKGLADALKIVEDHKKNADKVGAKELADALKIVEDYNRSIDKALEQYHQAATLDPMTGRYFFNCGRLHQAKYAAAAAEYQKLPEAARTAAEPKPEVKAALEAVNKEADGVINCWARFLALKSDYSAEVQTKVKDALTELYKYRNNSTEGLQKLIDDNKSSPTPVSMTPPAQPASPQKPSDDQSAMKANGGAGKPGEPTKPAAVPAKPVTKKPH